MGCPGCLPTQKEKQELLFKKEQEAKIKANEVQKLMVLYYLEDGIPEYMEAEAAKVAGIQPVKFVSFLPDSDNGPLSGLSL